MKYHPARLFILAALALCGITPVVAAGTVPAQLPNPDGKPGNPAKPVKVYLLAGQSNMVGMGDVSGARNRYTGVFLTADPAAPEGPLSIARVGNYKFGRLSVFLPGGASTDQPVAQGLLEVPENGVYRIYCGAGDRSSCRMELEGKGIYRREADGEPVRQDTTLEPGRRYAFRISGFPGDPPRFWLQRMDLLGHGDLETVTQREGKFPWLLDDKRNWTVRNDVFYYDARISFKGSPLSATSNGRSIGPELGFGHVMGTFHDEQVLLIKTAMGNRALGFDFRPPSSGALPDGTEASKKFESLEYKLMIEGVRKTLDQVAKIVPGYQGQGCELAGFVWFQGHKDSFSEELIAGYETNLVNLIQDLRREFKAAKMPVVVATVGFGGQQMNDKFRKIWAAQMAVGDPQKHPEFAGTVAAVDTRDFWREVDESPANQDYHYNRNAETYMLVGDSAGRAMVGLLGGQAEPLPQPSRPQAAAPQAPAPAVFQSPAAKAALAPILLDGIAPAHAADPRNHPALLAAARGEKPERPNPLLEDPIDALAEIYRTAGIEDYDWKPFGGDLPGAAWDYFCFDLPDTQARTKGIRDLKETCPAGMADWFAPGFDAQQAGWRSGAAPFGVRSDAQVPTPEWYKGAKRGEPRTVCEKDVLLLRQSFNLPALKDGHRYRVRVGGSMHANSGEGYAIYVNGKLLAESKGGIVAWRREGGKPRGGHVWADFRDAFKGGKVTIAVSNFPMNNRSDDRFIPPGAPLRFWLEEQRIPPLKPMAETGAEPLKARNRPATVPSP